MPEVADVQDGLEKAKHIVDVEMVLDVRRDLLSSLIDSMVANEMDIDFLFEMRVVSLVYFNSI